MDKRYGIAAASFAIGMTIFSLSPQCGWAQQQSQVAGFEIVLPPLPRLDNDQTVDKADLPCEPGKDDRRSDLCAQWKAADAAQVSAEWTRRTFWVGLAGLMLGFLTLGAALAAAIYAKKAAKSAQDSLSINGRAWLSIIPTANLAFRTGTTQHNVDGFYISSTFDVQNVGEAPAINVRLDADIGLSNEIDEEALAKFCDDWRKRIADNPGGEPVFAGQTDARGHELFLPRSKVDDYLATASFKAVLPVIYGCVSYFTGHVDGVRQVRFMYHLGTVDSSGRTLVLMNDQTPWHQKRIVLFRPGTIKID